MCDITCNVAFLCHHAQSFLGFAFALCCVVLCCRLKVLPDIVPTKCGTSWPVQVSLKQPKGPYSLHHALKLFWKHIIVFSR